MPNVKMSGATFKAFYSDPGVWPEGAFHEDEEILINGNARDESNPAGYEAVADSDEILVKGGYIITKTDDKPLSLTAVAAAWLKRVETVDVLVVCPKHRKEYLHELLSAHGFVYR